MSTRFCFTWSILKGRLEIKSSTPLPETKAHPVCLSNETVVNLHVWGKNRTVKAKQIREAWGGGRSE